MSDELRQQFADLEGQPLAHHADVLESLHGKVTAELDQLVIPRAARADTATTSRQ